MEVLLLKWADQNLSAVRKIASVFQRQPDEAAPKWFWLIRSAKVTVFCIFLFLGEFYLSAVPAAAFEHTHNNHHPKISVDLMQTLAGADKESIRVIIRLKRKPPEAQSTQGIKPEEISGLQEASFS